MAGNWGVREAGRLSVGAMWKELIEDLRNGMSGSRIAARYHAGVAAGFARAATRAREATGLGKVAMSGGCMNNLRLARLLRMKLEAEGFQVFQHVRVSPGDGGLSYGQVAVAAAMWRETSS